jgi:uracil-DNA glycosylase family 4
MNKVIAAVTAANNPDDPMQFVLDSVKPLCRQKLNEHIMDCSLCGANYKDNTKSLFYGDYNAPILFISDYPSMGQEDNRVFDSFGEDIIDAILDFENIDRNCISYINAVNCCPVMSDRNGQLIQRIPTQKEHENCSMFARYAVKFVQPLVIMLIGSTAVNIFHKVSIDEARKKWLYIENVPALSTYGMNYIKTSENPDDYKQIVYEDILKAFKYIEEIYPHVNIRRSNCE